MTTTPLLPSRPSRPSRLIIILSIIGSLLLAVVCVGPLILLLDLNDDQHFPSDQELIISFLTHRSTFMELQALFTSDLGVCIVKGAGLCPSSDWTQSIPEHRLARYQDLLQFLNLQQGASGVWKRGVWLYAYRSGNITASTEKGIVYLNSPPDAIVIDTESEERACLRSCYRHIEDNWYIFLIVD